MLHHLGNLLYLQNQSGLVTFLMTHEKSPLDVPVYQHSKE